MKMIMNDLREAEVFLRQQLPQGGRVLCAVSGGLDSMCLLHFVSSLEGFSVAAAHFNHRLRGEAADRDQSFVEDWCRERAIPCLTGQGDTRKRAAEQGESLEEAARNLRYAFLEEAGAEFDAILTAHHAQDNAETVLLNLLRGTGTAGLGGIPRQRGKLLRPFLPLERETLAAYSAEHHIPYVEDETNAEDAAARNVLRHRVMPVLKELNPRAVEHISRAAAIAAEENVLLEQMAEELAIRAEKKAAVLAAAPEILAGRAALCLLDRHCGGRRDLTARHAQQLLELAEKESGETHFPSGWIARKEGDALSFCCSEELPAVEIRPGESVWFGLWQAELGRQDNGGWAISVPDGEALFLTPWNSRDRMTLPGSRGGRSFKRLCADRGITPRRRDTLPVLRVGEKAAAAPGIGVDLEFAPKHGEEKIYIKFYLEGEQQQ